MRPPGRRTRAISTEDGRLVRRQVDDAVADDHVKRLGRQRDGLDVALQELHVRDACLGDVARRQGQHLVGHVQAEDATRGSDATRRQEHVDAAAGAQVEDPLALVQVGHGDGVAAAQRGEHRGVRQLAGCQRTVQLGGEARLQRDLHQLSAHNRRTQARSSSSRSPGPPGPSGHSARERARGSGCSRQSSRCPPLMSAACHGAIRRLCAGRTAHGRPT